jgi:hypothetical protein
MACHTVNMPFRALKLGYPNVIECELASRTFPETFPKTSRIRFEFPAREGLPPLKFWWYDGNPKEAFKPLRPDATAVREIISMHDELPESGALILGEKGKLFSPDDYGTRFFIAMKGKDDYIAGDEQEACKEIPQSIPSLAGAHERVVPDDERGHARLFQLRNRRLPGGSDSIGLRRVACWRGQADGMGWAEHALAEPSRSGAVCATA